MKYAYSTDDEVFYGDYDSLESCIEEANQIAIEEDKQSFSIGVVIHPIEKCSSKSIGSFISERIDEELAEQTDSDYGELELTDAQLTQLGDLVKGFFKDIHYPKFSVDDVKEYAVTEETEN